MNDMALAGGVPAFQLTDVVYRYNDVTALNGISMTIPHGTCLAILGANGSGKSTLLRLLDGLYFASGGAVTAFGSTLTEDQFADDSFALEFRRRVALVFQNPDVQLFNPTVFDEVAFGPLQMRWPADEIRRRVAEMLERFEISHLRDRPPHRLSGGEKKRVALASVLILDPDVLMLDEPTAALDPRSQRQIVDLLASYRGGGKTLITATHDLDTVGEIAEQAVIFQQGRCVASGTPDDLLNDTDLLLATNLILSPRRDQWPSTMA